MTATYRGPRTWSMDRDDDGHRTYNIVSRVDTDDKVDGPAIILQCPGLPQKGDHWIIGNDEDIWAFCQWYAKVTPVYTDGDPVFHWDVEQHFTTKPPDNKNCKDIQVEDPLLEPAKISGSFQKYTEEATKDRFDRPVITSSWEQISGQQNEWDQNRPSVKVEMNVGALDYGFVASLRDVVNQTPMWGFPKRTVKLSNFSWERKFYGLCYVYYTWTLEFDINTDGWDRDLLDEGTKCLKGHLDSRTGKWVLDPIDATGTMPDPRNPSHFIRYQDSHGNPGKVVLDGAGKPFDPTSTYAPSACGQCTGIDDVKLPLKFNLSSHSWYTAADGSIVSFGSAVVTQTGGCTWEGTNEDGIDITMTLGGTGWICSHPLFGAFTSWGGFGFSNSDCSPDLVAMAPTNTTQFIPGQQDPYAFDFAFARAILDVQPGKVHVEKYAEVDFFLLGLPTSF